MKKNKYKPQSIFHPGITLNEKLNEMRIKPNEFAALIGKHEKIIDNIINGKSSITIDIAFLFEDIFQIPAHFWINNQHRYDKHKIAK